MSFDGFDLNELFYFQSRIPLLNLNSNNNKKTAEKEIEFFNKLLGKEESLKVNLKKREKKQLLDLVFKSTFMKIEEKKPMLMGSQETPLDLRNQSKKNLRELTKTLTNINSLKQMHLIVDAKSMQFLSETIQSIKSLNSLFVHQIEDDVGALYLSNALESNELGKSFFL